MRRVRREHFLTGPSGTLDAFDDAYDAVTHTLARRDRLDKQIAALAADSEFTAVTRRLGCLRESAWHHKPRYIAGTTMRERWALSTAAAAARGDAGNRRLHHRWTVLTAHKKRHTVANTAIARELAGWCWSLAVMDD